ncbi:MAG: cation-transporting P-type ATPase [Planctomycetota bacterium]|nr:cation-transporting P-type ATPase [Planctomycetota bacterium]
MSSPPSDRQVDAAHAGPLSAVLAALGSDAQAGLTEEQAVAARAAHGPNRLAEVPPEPLWKKFLGQFKDLVIWILIVAAVLAGALGEWADSLAILAIVLLNGVLGFLQEARAERALAALKELATPMAKVRRGGKLQALPAADLVPGDAIELEAGDHVPADARLLEAFGLRAQEAALTGESAPVDKRPSDELDADTALGDRANMVYLGTMAAAGMARAVVVATGMRTELGASRSCWRTKRPSPRRCSGGWPNWGGCSSARAWPSWR